MRRILLSLLAIIVIAGLFAAAGYAGYHIGYSQGTQNVPSTANGKDTPHRELRPFDNDGPRGMPGRDFGFDRGFHRGFGMRGFHMMGFGLFSLLRFLVWIAILALIVWFIYSLFTRSGWQLTRTPQTFPPPAQPIETEAQNNNESPED